MITTHKLKQSYFDFFYFFLYLDFYLFIYFIFPLYSFYSSVIAGYSFVTSVFFFFFLPLLLFSFTLPLGVSSISHLIFQKRSPCLPSASLASLSHNLTSIYSAHTRLFENSFIFFTSSSSSPTPNGLSPFISISSKFF